MVTIPNSADTQASAYGSINKTTQAKKCPIKGYKVEEDVKTPTHIHFRLHIVEMAVSLSSSINNESLNIAHRISEIQRFSYPSPWFYCQKQAYVHIQKGLACIR